ncbi:hypothetical protein C8R44DRAFT_824826 [Mycena epipterygia]|nr:hypothetical protein C8R44DRAFT_824826 [Mycena epipterygia]
MCLPAYRLRSDSHSHRTDCDYRRNSRTQEKRAPHRQETPSPPPNMRPQAESVRARGGPPTLRRARGGEGRGGGGILCKASPSRRMRRTPHQTRPHRNHRNRTLSGGGTKARVTSFLIFTPFLSACIPILGKTPRTSRVPKAGTSLLASPNIPIRRGGTPAPHPGPGRTRAGRARPRGGGHQASLCGAWRFVSLRCAVVSAFVRAEGDLRGGEGEEGEGRGGGGAGYAYACKDEAPGFSASSVAGV